MFKCIYMIVHCQWLALFLIKLSQKCFVSLLKHNLSPPSWAAKVRSEAWEVYPLELYPPDDPPRPSRPKAGSGPSLENWLICLTLKVIYAWNAMATVVKLWMSAVVDDFQKKNWCCAHRMTLTGEVSITRYWTKTSKFWTIKKSDEFATKKLMMCPQSDSDWGVEYHGTVSWGCRGHPI